MEFDLILSAALGVALAAATGLRIFVPFLVMSAAAHLGYNNPGEGFAWLGTFPALAMLMFAAIVEIAAYYIPGVDNILDSIATPGAVLAGVLISAAAMTDLSPMLQWTLAIIAGGGAAGLTQAATTFLRGHSTLFTAGLGNPVIATGEILGATGISLLAIMAPAFAVLTVLVLLVMALRLFRGLARKSPGPRHDRSDAP